MFPFSARRRSARRKSSRTAATLRRAFVEPLEERRLLAAYVVDSVADDTSPFAFSGDGSVENPWHISSLRGAIIAANFSPGVPDTITLPAGVYTLAIPGANEDDARTGDLDILDGLSIIGAGAGSTIIQAGTSTAAGIDRVFHVINPPPGIAPLNVSFSGVTIRHGRASSDHGGGILNSRGHVEITNSKILANAALGGNGGGVHTQGPGSVTGGFSLIVRNSEISGNAGVDGGGIYAFNDHVELHQSVVLNNLATVNGGGIYAEFNPVFPPRTLVVAESTINGNSAQMGGGIYARNDAVTVDRSTLAGNFATVDGGGIWHDYSLRIVNSTLSGNIAGEDGGALYSADAPFNPQRPLPTRRIEASTLTGNRADSDDSAIGSGGGIFTQTAGPAFLNSTIVAGNFRGSAASADDVAGQLDAASHHNLIGAAATAGGLTDGINNNKVGHAVATVLNATLAENGGPTKTHALVVAVAPAVNPAVNAGDSNLTGGVDQRGQPRGANPDIGAFEMVSSGRTDWGDLNDSFGTLSASNGPNHAITIEPLYLGSYIDAEPDANTQLVLVDGKLQGLDDLTYENGLEVRDEDGLAPSFFAASPNSATSGTFLVSSVGQGYLDAWMDFNLDGNFGQSVSGAWQNDEQVFDGQVYSEHILTNVVVNGRHQLSFRVPPITRFVAGFTTFGTRFRLAATAEEVTSPLGSAQSGEVEDYSFFFFPGPARLPFSFGGVMRFTGLSESPFPYDPAIAAGYDYVITAGSNFKSVVLPTVVGDDVYTLHVDPDGMAPFDYSAAPIATLVGGVTYDFTAGFTDAGGTAIPAVPAGHAAFRILGIETAVMIDPADPLGFVTVLANTSGTGEFTQTAIPEEIYVDRATNFAITAQGGNPGNNQSPTIPDAEDIVTWFGRAGADDDVTGLVFGATAFASIQAATNRVDNNDWSDLAVINSALGSLTLTVSPATVSEGAGQSPVVGTLSRSGDTTNALVVALTSSDPTAASVPEIVTFLSGQASLTFPVNVVNDGVVDGDQTATVVASADGFFEATAALVVLDDDREPLPTFTLSPVSVALQEDGLATSITATLSALSDVDVVIELSFSGDAANGTDYVRSTESIVILAGNRTGSLTLTVRTDDEDETDERIVIDVVAVRNGSEVGNQQVVATIVDDDATPIDRAKLATGAGARGGPHVQVFSREAATLTSFYSQAPTFDGGVRVALGDVTGDGIADTIVGSGPGIRAQVKVFDGVSGAELLSFFPYSETFFSGGVNVAAADLDGDGRADIITGANAGGGPHVKVFSGATGAVIWSFYAYNSDFAGGVSVAAADIDADGTPDIITGAGSGGGPHVKAYSGRTNLELRSFYAFHERFSRGVSVAGGDLDGDGLPEIVVGAGAGELPTVKVFGGENGLELQSFFAFRQDFQGGVTVATTDFNDDGLADIVVGAGPGGGPHVRVLRSVDLAELLSVYAYEPDFSGGVFVAGIAPRAAVPVPSIASASRLDERRLAALHAAAISYWDDTGLAVQGLTRRDDFFGDDQFDESGTFV